MKDKEIIAKQDEIIQRYEDILYGVFNYKIQKGSYSERLKRELASLKSQEPKTNIKKRRTRWRDFTMTDKEPEAEKGIEEVILRHFHGFTKEQWNELKHDFPYCEIEPILHDFARQSLRDELIKFVHEFKAGITIASIDDYLSSR